MSKELEYIEELYNNMYEATKYLEENKDTIDTSETGQSIVEILEQQNEGLEIVYSIKQILIKEQENENKALAFDYLVKHFNFECKADSLRDGEVWARFVTIQSKDDEGTWDTTAMANLVDYKEEYEFLEKMLKPKN